MPPRSEDRPAINRCPDCNAVMVCGGECADEARDIAATRSASAIPIAPRSGTRDLRELLQDVIDETTGTKPEMSAEALLDFVRERLARAEAFDEATEGEFRLAKNCAHPFLGPTPEDGWCLWCTTCGRDGGYHWPGCKKYGGQDLRPSEDTEGTSNEESETVGSRRAEHEAHRCGSARVLSLRERAQEGSPAPPAEAEEVVPRSAEAQGSPLSAAYCGMPDAAGLGVSCTLLRGHDGQHMFDVSQVVAACRKPDIFPRRNDASSLTPEDVKPLVDYQAFRVKRAIVEWLRSEYAQNANAVAIADEIERRFLGADRRERALSEREVQRIMHKARDVAEHGTPAQKRDCLRSIADLLSARSSSDGKGEP